VHDEIRRLFIDNKGQKCWILVGGAGGRQIDGDVGTAHLEYVEVTKAEGTVYVFYAHVQAASFGAKPLL
jgi:hypothetical protein